MSLKKASGSSSAPGAVPDLWKGQGRLDFNACGEAHEKDRASEGQAQAAQGQQGNSLGRSDPVTEDSTQRGGPHQ
jgi:hypothetical protein